VAVVVDDGVEVADSKKKMQWPPLQQDGAAHSSGLFLPGGQQGQEASELEMTGTGVK
jgi:hypothetical protein